MMTVDEIMTEKPVTLDAGATLALAGELMLANRIRHIPIVDDENRIQGLLTQRDLLTEVRGDQERPVADVMRKNVRVVAPTEDMRSAALLMQKYKIGSLAVVDQGKLVGIVTDSDYVSLAINLLEQIAEFEPGEGEDFEDLDVLDVVEEFDTDDDQ